MFHVWVYEGVCVITSKTPVTENPTGVDRIHVFQDKTRTSLQLVTALFGGARPHFGSGMQLIRF